MTPKVEYFDEGELVKTVTLRNQVNVRDLDRSIELDVSDVWKFVIAVLVFGPDKLVFKPDRSARVTHETGGEIKYAGSDGITIDFKKLNFRKSVLQILL